VHAAKGVEIGGRVFADEHGLRSAGVSPAFLTLPFARRGFRANIPTRITIRAYAPLIFRTSQPRRRDAGATRTKSRSLPVRQAGLVGQNAASLPSCVRAGGMTILVGLSKHAVAEERVDARECLGRFECGGAGRDAVERKRGLRGGGN